MSHMLRKNAERLTGKHVIAHHVEGWSCHGVLHSSTRDGIYLMNAQMIEQMSASDQTLDVQHSIGHNPDVDAAQAFFPFFFIPFVALTGIAAASAFARPPYYYGYGGYPGPYGYGYGPNHGYW